MFCKYINLLGRHLTRSVRAGSSSGLVRYVSTSFSEFNDAGNREDAMPLRIGNPAAFLNAIAGSYKSMPRILMEYVDNSLDSASMSEGRIEKTVVEVDIDRLKSSIWIRDNCMGMDPVELMRIVQSVGDSRKRDLEATNGQFGFGVHAFRAAAKTLKVYSASMDSTSQLAVVTLSRDEFTAPYPVRHSLDEVMKFDKDVCDAVSRRLFSSSGSIFPSGSTHGTAVLLDGIDEHWFESARMKLVQEEIEKHFESMLYEKNLEIVIRQISKHFKKVKLSESKCEPFNYDSLKGKRICNSFSLGKEGKRITYDIVVSRTPKPERRVRFFRKGRNIGAVTDIRSFMESSKEESGLWGHPNVCGYIEVGGALEPVLTRDEFRKDKIRDEVYQALGPLEVELSAALKSFMSEMLDDTMKDLEEFLQGSLDDAFREDMKQDRAEDDDDEDEPDRRVVKKREPVVHENMEFEHVVQDVTGKDEKQERTRKAQGIFEVHFVRHKSDGPGDPPRSFSVENKIYMNLDHNELKTRLNAQSDVGSRVASYLANELAKYQRLRRDEDSPEMGERPREVDYALLIGAVNKLEERLSLHLKKKFLRDLQHL